MEEWLTFEKLEWLIKTGSIYGLGFVAIAGMLVLIFYGAFYGINAVIALVNDIRLKWMPQLVSGHLTFLEHTKVTTAATSEAVTKLTDSYTASMDNHGKTHRALECIAKAQQQGEVNDEARRFLEDAINELK